jgi:hypothetical protein
MIHVHVDLAGNSNIAVKLRAMTEDEVKRNLDMMVKLATETSPTIILNLMSQYTSLYHHRRDDESLIKMNTCMVVLLIQQGLMDPEKALQQSLFIVKQNELLDAINHIQS